MYQKREYVFEEKMFEMIGPYNSQISFEGSCDFKTSNELKNIEIIQENQRNKTYLKVV